MLWYHFISLKYPRFDIGKYLMYSIRFVFFSITSNYRESQKLFFICTRSICVCVCAGVFVPFKFLLLQILHAVARFHQNLMRSTHLIRNMFKFNHIHPVCTDTQLKDTSWKANMRGTQRLRVRSARLLCVCIPAYRSGVCAMTKNRINANQIGSNAKYEFTCDSSQIPNRCKC